MEESLLIQRVLEGDPTAERRLYDTHVDRVYGLAYRMTGDPEMAREFAQEAFIRAFDRLSGFRQESALSTWLYAITSSVCLNGLRKVKRAQQRHVDMEAATHLGDTPRLPDPHLKDRLTAAINQLDDKHRMVFVLHDIEHQTHDQIAQILEIKNGTSKARLSRARSQLRESLTAFATEWTYE